MECAQNRMTETVSRSSSMTASNSKGILDSKDLREIFSKEMGEKEITTGVTKYAKKFVENMSRYAQRFGNDFSETFSEDIISELDWASNYVFKEDRRQIDWKGRSIELKGFRKPVL